MLQAFDRKAFLERLTARIHLLLDRKVKADVLIYLGRKDERTGEELPPVVQVMEHGL